MGWSRQTGELAPLTDVVKLYLEDVERTRTTRTRGAYEGPLRLYTEHLRAELGREPLLSDVTLDSALSWMDALQREPKRLNGGRKTGDTPVSRETVRTYLRALRVFTRWLTRPPYRVTKENPLADLKLPRASRSRKQPLDENDLAALLNATDRTTLVGARDHAMLLILIDGGLRASELTDLTRGDLSIDHNTVFVAHGKGDKSRFVTLGHATLADLRAYLLIHEALVRGAAASVYGRIRRPPPDDLNDAPLFPTIHGDFYSYQGLKTWFRAIAARAGVHGAHLHLLRHTSATQMLNAGADVHFVQLKLGHQDINTTLKYLHLAEDRIAEHQQPYSPVDYLGIADDDGSGQRRRQNRTARGSRPLWRQPDRRRTQDKAGSSTRTQNSGSNPPGKGRTERDAPAKRAGRDDDEEPGAPVGART
jgi:site-specific recombinase XerD